MTSNVVQYAHGSDFELNLLKDGTIRINLSPNNKYGILDFPDFLPRKVIQIAATGNHALVLLDDETVYGWGADHYGQCPNYNFQKDGRKVIQIEAGNYFSLALLDDGTVRYWGANIKNNYYTKKRILLLKTVKEIWVEKNRMKLLLADGRILDSLNDKDAKILNSVIDPDGRIAKEDGKEIYKIEQQILQLHDKIFKLNERISYLK